MGAMMTEGATAELLREADTAGADAASEARGEVLADVPAGEPSKEAKKATAKQGDGWHRFAGDVWITNLNSGEFGIYKRTRNKAKSRQFSYDNDIFGEVIEKRQPNDRLGYREDLGNK